MTTSFLQSVAQYQHCSLNMGCREFPWVRPVFINIALYAIISNGDLCNASVYNKFTFLCASIALKDMVGIDE